MGSRVKVKAGQTPRLAEISGRPPRSRAVRTEQRLARLFRLLAVTRKRLARIAMPPQLQVGSREFLLVRRGLAREKAAFHRLTLILSWYIFQAMSPDLPLTKATRIFVRRLRRQGVKVSRAGLYQWDADFGKYGIEGLATNYHGGRRSQIHEADRAMICDLWRLASNRNFRTVYRAYTELRTRDKLPGSPIRFPGAQRIIMEFLESEEGDRRRGRPRTRG